MCYYPGSDINTLLVAPRHVERSDFFGTFYDILKDNEDVKKLRVNCKVSLILFMFDSYKY